MNKFDMVLLVSKHLVKKFEFQCCRFLYLFWSPSFPFPPDLFVDPGGATTGARGGTGRHEAAGFGAVPCVCNSVTLTRPACPPPSSHSLVPKSSTGQALGWLPLHPESRWQECVSRSREREEGPQLVQLLGLGLCRAV